MYSLRIVARLILAAVFADAIISMKVDYRKRSSRPFELQRFKSE